MDESDDPYVILGVTKDASATEIKKAYRTLALKNHPDKQCNEVDREKASSVFAKIAAAYEILSDEEERKQYDLRKKYGGAPGTRYTTTNENSPMPSPGTSKTSRVYRAPTNTARQNDSRPPESGTFKFSYDPSKVRSSNPYEIFKEVFGSDFKNAYPGSVLSPGKSQRCNSVPLASGNKASPLKPRKSTTSHIVPQQSAMRNDDVVSLSKSTRTVCHDDGTHEVITETTITTADGMTKTTRESSTTKPSSIPKTIKTNKPTGGNYLTSVKRK
jgi:DnaJ-class molecular chaperone